MRRLRIVIADTDSEVCRDLNIMLSRAGLMVIGEANDGYAALKMIRSFRPDLSILGADLPMISGIEAAGIIEEEKTSPVILTVSPQQGLVLQNQPMFISGYLVKPFRENDLIPAIELTMSNHRKLLSIDKVVKSLEDKLETRKILERAKGVLMDSLNISESDAFNRIRKQSMNKRKPMRTIAEAILVADEVQK
jgi:two-component system, response regulator PdtaR